MSQSNQFTFFEDETSALALTNEVTRGWSEVVKTGDEIYCRFFTRWDSENDTEDIQSQSLLCPSDFKAPDASIMYTAALMTEFLHRFTENPEGSQPHYRFAITGGIAVKLITSDPRRVTDDVDFSFKGSIPRLWQGLMTQPALKEDRFNRFILPKEKLYSGAFRIFVKVGPRFGDPLQQNNHIRIEFLTEIGPPARGSLDWTGMTTHRDFIVRGQTYSVPIVDVMPLLASKLKAYTHRQALRDYNDIVSLLDTFKEQIAQSRGLLQITYKRYFIHNPPRGYSTQPEHAQILFDATPSPPSDAEYE